MIANPDTLCLRRFAFFLSSIPLPIYDQPQRSDCVNGAFDQRTAEDRHLTTKDLTTLSRESKLYWFVKIQGVKLAAWNVLVLGIAVLVLDSIPRS